MASFKSLPGFRDFYPEDLAPRTHLFRQWRQSAHAYGFQEYDAPVLESLDLYKAKSGDEIEAQLFSFTDKGDREVALRPEMTPTVCRMVGSKANALKRPIKWFSIADFFRYERMQKGRGRCFAQFNADIFGEAGPEAEIELISLLIQCLRGLGLQSDDFYVRLSDRNLWFYYLEALGLSDEQVRGMLGAIDKFERLGESAFEIYTKAHGAMADELKAGVLRMLAIKSLPDLEAVVAELDNAQLTERLDDWRKVLGGLDAMGLSDFVSVDLGVVRGLAYYTGFVFEAFDRKGDLRALAGGGRYNDLVKKLGGPDLPAVGFAIGDMTMELLLRERGLLPDVASKPDVYVVLGGPEERLAAFGDIAALRAVGYRVDYPMKDLGFGKQFKNATESGARVALIYGGDELAKGVVKLRDLSQREEVEVPREQIADAVRDFLTA
ncbi:histidine--tRNA ligase [Opitutaceae bacterium]|nr:histidine--tRNA ligase [Opitutaceae bacterium]